MLTLDNAMSLGVAGQCEHHASAGNETESHAANQQTYRLLSFQCLTGKIAL